jgi:UDP:flavonoid glycosyltransferase YjiC (YdhE family)
MLYSGLFAMRCLLCPLATPGFLYPAIGLALSLQSAGHEVAFATGATFAETLARVGLRRIPRGQRDGPSFEVESWHHPLSIAIQLKHVEHALASFPADVIVASQLALGPLLAAERRRVPVVVQGLCTYLWPTGDDDETSSSRATRERRAWRLGDMLGHLETARAIMRLPAVVEPTENPFVGALFLLRSVAELEGPEHLLPAGVHLVGDQLWEPDSCDPEVESWIEESVSGGFRIVYVQHGRSFSTPGFWPQLREAAGDQRVRVAASTGRMDGEVGPVPEGWIVRSHLPQARVLARAAAVVASANTTAVLGALSHGVPLVLIPGGGEQVDVAERCAAAGVAVVLSPETVTAVALSAAIRQILDEPGFGHRARQLAMAFRSKRAENLAPILVESVAKGRYAGRGTALAGRRS